MEKDNSVYLKHVMDSVKRIEEYTKDVGKEQFMAKPIIQAAVIREIEIIGEAIINSRKLIIQYLGRAWQECGISLFMGILALI